MHPGDILKAKSRLRVGYDLVRFLQYIDQPDYDCAHHGTNGFMGVSENGYGYHYENAAATPYTFILGDKLYYLGELDGAHNFSETITLDTELGSVTPDYTVTWKNYDGTLIDTNRVYQGHHPVYSTVTGAEPTRPDDDDYRYTFSGWTDGTKAYGKTDTLPAVTGDITYTATYTAAPLPTYTITWENWDGTTITTTSCKEGKAPVYQGDVPTRPATTEYTFTFAGWLDDSNNHYAVGNELPKAYGAATYTAYYTSSERPKLYTVTWKSFDGTVLETDENVPAGKTPHFDGTIPPRAADSEYSYKFNTWTPYLQPVSGDVTYTVQYAKTPKDPPAPIEGIENIFKTDDGMAYDLKGMFYRYNGATLSFNWEETSAFHREGDSLYLGDQLVADIGIELKNDKYVAEFANTVFVSGAGSYSQPFEFHPNYTYSSDYSKISDGCPVALNEESTNSQKIANIAYPGDSFKGTSGAKMTPDNSETHAVRFISKNGDERTSASYFVGVGTTTYGVNYSGNKAEHEFTEGCDTLYYHGEDNNNAYVFSETPPKTQISFGTAELPDFFAGHSLTLQGDIGIYFFVDVTAAGITPDSIKNGTDSVTFSFSWKADPAPYSDPSAYNITLSKDNYDELFDEETSCFKIKCGVAAAEMTCQVHVDAQVSGSVTYSDSDDYSVREYADVIIKNENSTFSDSLIDLVKAMLDYGAKAQLEFGIHTAEQELANYGVTGYTMENVTTDMVTETVNTANGKNKSDMSTGVPEGLVYYTSSLVYLTKSSLRHYYYVKDQSVLNAAVNSLSADSQFKYHSDKLPFAYFEMTDIAAADLDALQDFTLSGNTYYFSALDFVGIMLNAPEGAIAQADRDLAMATYWYNHYANLYFDTL